MKKINDENLNNKKTVNNGYVQQWITYFIYMVEFGDLEKSNRSGRQIFRKFQKQKL